MRVSEHFENLHCCARLNRSGIRVINQLVCTTHDSFSLLLFFFFLSICARHRRIGEGRRKMAGADEAVARLATPLPTPHPPARQGGASTPSPPRKVKCNVAFVSSGDFGVTPRHDVVNHQTAVNSYRFPTHPRTCALPIHIRLGTNARRTPTHRCKHTIVHTEAAH